MTPYENHPRATDPAAVPAKSTLNADIRAALDALDGCRLTNVFFVACGGSLSIMYSGKYFMDRHGGGLACDIYNADEFVCRAPRGLGPTALVILCSQTGTTRETVRAAEFARRGGATTIAMTLDPASPLARAADHVVL